jgi:hypothetical protein
LSVWVGAAEPNLVEATIAGAVSAPARTQRRLMVMGTSDWIAFTLALPATAVDLAEVIGRLNINPMEISAT